MERQADVQKEEQVDFVRPGMALGTRFEAENARLLTLYRIDAVLSLVQASVPASVEVLNLTLNDGMPIPPASLERAFAFLSTCAARSARVLVHCEMGLSRSPTVLAGYLVERERIPFERAIAEMRLLRPLVQPHPALVRSVNAYLHERFAAGPLRGVA